MKFYDRQTELESLKQIEIQSTENACFTVVVGRRRVGKTYLLLKSMEEKNAFTFLSHGKAKPCFVSVSSRKQSKS